MGKEIFDDICQLFSLFYFCSQKLDPSKYSGLSSLSVALNPKEATGIFGS